MFYIVAVFGLIIGSCLNVVINRLYTKEDIIKKRSHCPECGAILKWYELIPVVSFIIQRGKCRKCNEKISWQYPFVEIATALIFLQVFNYQLSIINQLSTFNYQFLIGLAFLFVVAGGLIIIFVYDLKHFIIPDIVLAPLVLLTSLAILFDVWTFGNWEPFGNWKLITENSTLLSSLTSALLVGLLASLPFFVLNMVSGGRAMGFGDVKLAFFLGLFLDFQTVGLAIFLAFILGGIVGGGLIIFKKKKVKSRVPVGPFLVLGTYIALFWGHELVDWYLDKLAVLS